MRRQKYKQGNTFIHPIPVFGHQYPVNSFHILISIFQGLIYSFPCLVFVSSVSVFLSQDLFFPLSMFVISCHALFLSPEVIDEENFAFKITFLISYNSNNRTFFFICPIWLPFRHFFIFLKVTNSNIQSNTTDLEC